MSTCQLFGKGLEAMRRLQTPVARVTMADLARLAGVSIPTVSRALRNVDSVSQETRKRIHELAAEHGFTANSAARALRGVASRKVALVIDFQASGPGRTSPDAFIFELLADVAHALTIRDFEVALCARVDTVDAYVRQFADIGVSGAIFFGQAGQQAILEDLALMFPIVVWGAVLPRSRYVSVGSDNMEGGRLAAARLVADGRKAALMIGDPSTAQVSLRFEGFEAVFAEGGRRTGTHAVSGFSYEDVYHSLGKRLGDGAFAWDAVFAATDTLAMAAIRALSEAGLRVPVDVAVIGYNDIPQSQAFEPPLTTIREDDHRAGSLLVEKLMQVRDGLPASSVRLSVSLVKRHSA